MSVRNGNAYAKGLEIDVDIDRMEFGDCDMSELNIDMEEASAVKDLEQAPADKSAGVKGNRASLDGAVLKFEKIKFVVGKGKREKIIVKDISATVTHGRKYSPSLTNAPITYR